MKDVLLHGDCLELLRGLEANSVDACVTDPPYGLGEVKDMAGLLLAWLHDQDDSTYIGKSGFMGKEWDAGVPSPRYWREVYRVLKPGAHVLCFAGTRTLDLMSLSLRLAGFECRDTVNHLAWCYGSGFPKSHNISAAIDRMKGAERPIIGTVTSGKILRANGQNERPYQQGRDRIETPVTAPATPEAKRWQGFGSALKPAWEPILLFRKPLAAANLASNVLAWGTGAINIDGCRVAWHGSADIGDPQRFHRTDGGTFLASNPANTTVGANQAGRWPPNFLMSHSPACTPAACSDECAVAEIDEQAGERKSGIPTAGKAPTTLNDYGKYNARSLVGGGDSGPVSRFFPCFFPVAYHPKASRRERNAGCEALPEREMSDWPQGMVPGATRRARAAANNHPTVKSLALCRWLARLITPPDGTVLDCFAGSGSTLVACVQEGFHFIGMEQSEEYCTIARARIAAAKRQPAKPRAKVIRLPKRPKAVEQLALFA